MEKEIELKSKPMIYQDIMVFYHSTDLQTSEMSTFCAAHTASNTFPENHNSSSSGQKPPPRKEPPGHQPRLPARLGRACFKEETHLSCSHLLRFNFRKTTCPLALPDWKQSPQDQSVLGINPCFNTRGRESDTVLR